MREVRIEDLTDAEKVLFCVVTRLCICVRLLRIAIYTSQRACCLQVDLGHETQDSAPSSLDRGAIDVVCAQSTSNQSCMAESQTSLKRSLDFGSDDDCLEAKHGRHEQALEGFSGNKGNADKDEVPHERQGQNAQQQNAVQERNAVQLENVVQEWGVVLQQQALQEQDAAQRQEVVQEQNTQRQEAAEQQNTQRQEVQEPFKVQEQDAAQRHGAMQEHAGAQERDAVPSVLGIPKRSRKQMISSDDEVTVAAGCLHPNRHVPWDRKNSSRQG